MGLTAETKVGQIVAERIGRAAVLDRWGLDYCCNGGKPLGVACEAKGADVAAVLAALEASDKKDAAEGDDRTDYAAMPASALADHIESTHHAYLKGELPRLWMHLRKVIDVHGDRHPELAEMGETFSGLRAELESHMMKEEQVLFPLIRRLDQAREAFSMHCGSVGNPIRVMEHEHATAGEALARLHSLSDGYRPPADGCTTYRALFDGLARLEFDLHRHIHKENNILFPRAAALEEALSRASG